MNEGCVALGKLHIPDAAAASLTDGDSIMTTPELILTLDHPSGLLRRHSHDSGLSDEEFNPIRTVSVDSTETLHELEVKSVGSVDGEREKSINKTAQKCKTVEDKQKSSNDSGKGDSFDENNPGINFSDIEKLDGNHVVLENVESGTSCKSKSETAPLHMAEQENSDNVETAAPRSPNSVQLTDTLNDKISKLTAATDLCSLEGMSDRNAESETEVLEAST